MLKRSILPQIFSFVMTGALFIPGSCFAAELILNVEDEGTALSRAEIIVMDSVKRIMVHSGFTDKQGRYRHELQPGRYEVMISKDEYTPAVVKDIVIANAAVQRRVELVLSAFTSIHEPAPTESDGCDD